MAYIFKVFGSLFTVVMWYFIASLVGKNYDNYFTFVLLGIGAQSAFNTHLHTLSRRIREEQVTGTLEQVLSTPTPPAYLLIAGYGADLFNSAISFFLLIALGALFFDFPLGGFQLLWLIPAFILCTMAFTALSSLAAGGVIFLQRGEPFSFFFSAFQALFGTVFFPLSIYPSWVQWLVYATPMTHALNLLRTPFHQNLFSPWISLIYLLGCLGFFFALGVALFHLSIRDARKRGTLGVF